MRDGGKPMQLKVILLVHILLFSFLLTGCTEESEEEGEEDFIDIMVEIPPIETCNGTGVKFVEENGFVTIEAENYTSCLYGVGKAEGSQWELSSEISNYTGEGYVVVNPSEKLYMGDSDDGARLNYNITFSNPGNYTIWLRMSAPNGSSDSIHVGLNGEPISYGYGVATKSGDVWTWQNSSCGHCSGDKLKLEVFIPSGGEYEVNIWMREDGVKVDSMVVTLDFDYNPSDGE